MANKRPGFVTGANAKIKSFGNIMAYCTDVAYNIAVQTIPIEAMGRYEVFSNEPVAYTVDGSFSVIRYTKRASEDNIEDTANDGNAPTQVSDGDRNMGEHLDPSKLLLSETFDLEIHEKNEGDNDVRVFEVKDCRLNRRGMTLNKRGVMVDNYAFVGILAGDADSSDNEVAVSNSGEEDLS